MTTRGLSIKLQTTVFHNAFSYASTSSPPINQFYENILPEFFIFVLLPHKINAMSPAEHQLDTCRNITHTVLELPVDWLEFTSHLELRLGRFHAESLAAATILAELEAAMNPLRGGELSAFTLYTPAASSPPDRPTSPREAVRHGQLARGNHDNRPRHQGCAKRANFESVHEKWPGIH